METNNESDRTKPKILPHFLIPLLVFLGIFISTPNNLIAQEETNQTTIQRYHIRYFLGIEPKPQATPFFEPRYEPYAELMPFERFEVETYIAVFYAYPSLNMTKAQMYYKGEHIKTLFFTESQRLELERDYIQFYERWNGIRGIPFADTRLEWTDLRYYPEYFKVYLYYPDRESDRSVITAMAQYLDQEIVRAYTCQYDETYTRRLSEIHELEPHILLSSIVYDHNSKGWLTRTHIIDDREHTNQNLEVIHPGEDTSQTR